MLSERAKKMMKSGVKYPLAKSTRELETGELVKLCSNENPIGPSSKAVKVLKREAGKVGEYPDPSSMELKKAIGEYLGVNTNMICVGNGSDEIMDLVCKIFIDPSDECLIPIPTFSMYEIACRVNFGEPKFIELPDFQWQTKDMLEALSGAKLAFIGRPNNPTGNSIDEGGLRELLETRKPIIVDEAYAEFSDYSIIEWTKSYENLLVLRTFSKIFGLAGLRIGYSIGSSKIIKVLERIRPPFNVNRLAQSAAIAALEDEEFVQEVKKMVITGREYLQEELSKLDFRVLPSDTNFLMVGLENLEADAPKICDYLAESGILVRDLTDFRGAGPNWIRITIGKPDQNEKLINTLKAFKGG